MQHKAEGLLRTANKTCHEVRERSSRPKDFFLVMRRFFTRPPARGAHSHRDTMLVLLGTFSVFALNFRF